MLIMQLLVKWKLIVNVACTHVAECVENESQ